MIALENVLKSSLHAKGNFIAGEWRLPDRTARSFEVVSPANLEWRLPSIRLSPESVEEAVNAGRRAGRAWRELPMEQRISYCERFAEELQKRGDSLGRVIALETGKPLDEALTEAGLLVNKIRVTIDEALKLVRSYKFELATGQGRGEVRWLPKGVLAILGPFNFPVHLAHGQIIPALLMGNVCIFKPSEKTPYSAQTYLEAAEAAGFPPGVLQLVQGDAEIATRLVRHTRVDGVLATCSYDVGVKIRKETAENPEKIIALEMGGKNGALIWDAPSVETVADALVRSSFLTTGQRCTALSRVYVKRALLEPLVDAVHARAKELVISHPFETDPKPFMGPLISAGARDKFLRYSAIAESEKAEAIMRPKSLEGVPRMNRKPLPSGHYVTPSIHVVSAWSPRSNYQSHEIFGPDVFFCPIDDCDEGLEALNSSPYGLVASLFVESERRFLELADRVECGLVYYNRPTVGASARLPFGGWKRSGNHRPAGLFAIYATAQVQSRIL